MILLAFYYFLPAYISNMMPPLVQWFSFLDKPIDFGRSFNGRRIFGDHKTIRGFLVSCLFGTLFFLFQKYLYQFSFFYSISIINYSETSWLLGFSLAFGAIFGDLIGSFFKRRVNIKPGKPWIPFDQLDYVVGAFFFSFLIFIPSKSIFIIIIVLSLILQLVFHYLGYLLGINKDKI